MIGHAKSLPGWSPEWFQGTFLSFLGLIFSAPLERTGAISGASEESGTLYRQGVQVEKAPILDYALGDLVR